MNANLQNQLAALGFELDTGGFWQRGDDLSRVTIDDDAQLGWVLIVETLTGDDPQLGPGQPVEVLRMHFGTRGATLVSALVAGDTRRFSLCSESGEPEPISLSTYITENEDLDEAELAQIAALKPGDSMNFGGGAAPIFTLKREA